MEKESFICGYDLQDDCIILEPQKVLMSRLLIMTEKRIALYILWNCS